jgi:hypothetical protein
VKIQGYAELKMVEQASSLFNNCTGKMPVPPAKFFAALRMTSIDV